MAKKLSLKPVQAALKKIRKQLIAEKGKAKAPKKAELQCEIEKVNELIAAVPIACKRYSVG
jgi:hypothetical protein